MTEKTVLPPYPNRGVENTLQSGLRSCVDWLQVTFKSVQSLHDIYNILGLDSTDFTEFETGKYGYQLHVRFGHIAIYYSPNQPHYHLEITGQGCREYEEFGKYKWIELLGMILMLDVNITRFDIAIDDFEGYFKITNLVKKMKKGHVRSRFREAKYMEKIKLSDGSTRGETVYFGSPKSDIQVRIYDKFQERIGSGHTIVEGVTVWNRTEIQMRDKRALQACFELVENIYSVGPMVQGILRNYVMFCDPKGDDTNKARWNTSKFWEKFLNNVQPLKLTQVAPDATIEKVERWFNHSVSANFALLMEAHDYNIELINDWIMKGRTKQKKKHENMLKRYKRGLHKKNVSSGDEDTQL